MTEARMCIYAIISGNVQGVFFRDGTKKQAESLQLTGWVKNLNDGTVELKACGDRDHVILLTDWLWQGPDTAEVSNVHWEEVALEDFDEFQIL